MCRREGQTGFILWFLVGGSDGSAGGGGAREKNEGGSAGGLRWLGMVFRGVPLHYALQCAVYCPGIVMAATTPVSFSPLRMAMCRFNGMWEGPLG